MKKTLGIVGLLIILTGCTSDPQDNIPVVNISIPRTDRANILEQEKSISNTETDIEPVTDTVNVIPQGEIDDIQISSDITQSQNIANNAEQTQPLTSKSTDTQINTILPTANSFKSGKPLDSAVLALLTTAQQQQDANKLDAAAASIERAQRIDPSEPRVLYSLATVRLKQGDAAEAEQLAKRALSYTSADQTDLKSSLLDVIASALDMQGDQAGADKARQQKLAQY